MARRSDLNFLIVRVEMSKRPSASAVLLAPLGFFASSDAIGSAATAIAAVGLSVDVGSTGDIISESISLSAIVPLRCVKEMNVCASDTRSVTSE